MVTVLKVCAARVGTSLLHRVRQAFDFIFTVCDNAAGEVCPVWIGHPTTAHWGIPDPAHIEGDAARRAAFDKAAEQLAHRIRLFMQLPFETMDKLSLKDQLAAIGRTQD